MEFVATCQRTFPLIKDENFLEETLNLYGTYFWKTHDQMLCNKFGFDELKESDEEFFINWQGFDAGTTFRLHIVL